MRKEIHEVIVYILKELHGLMLLALGCLTGMCAAAGFHQMMDEYFHRPLKDDSYCFYVWLVVWFFVEMGFLRIIEIKKKDKKK